MGGKGDNHVTWKLNYELWINYELDKENTKFRELNSIYWTQWLPPMQWKLWLMCLGMNYEKMGKFSLKNSENWVTQVQVTLSWTHMYLSRPHLYYSFQNVSNVFTERIQCVLNVVSKQDCTAFYLKLLQSTHSKCTSNQSPIDNHQDLSLFNLLYLIVIYFAFIYSLSNLITFINPVFELHWITQVMFIL